MWLLFSIRTSEEITHQKTDFSAKYVLLFLLKKKKQTTSPSPKTNKQTPLSLNMEKIGFPEGENTHAVH